MARVIMWSRWQGRAALTSALALVIALPWAIHAGAGGPPFRQLSGTEIQKKVIGMMISDEAHWSDRLYPDGSLKSYDLGRLKPGSWVLQGSELCLTRTGKRKETDCFEIWTTHDVVQYRRDGVMVLEGYLRDISKN